MKKIKIGAVGAYKKLKDLYKKYERQLIPATLVFGFVVDIVTFKSIDIIFTFLIVFAHLGVVAILIAFINIYDSKQNKNKLLRFLRLFAPLLMQFSFGALLSASFIFYTFSGAFSVSWPFIITILFLMVSNEIFKQSYLKVSVQLSVFFFVLITVISLSLPFAFNSISPWVFVLSGFVALVIIYFYIKLLSRNVSSIRQNQRRYMFYVSSIFIFINVLYFLNVIPPVPLVLRDGGAYHSVVHAGGDYELLDERQSLWQKLIPGKTIHIKEKGLVYIFTAVFSPADLNTDIIHHWQKYNEVTGEWDTVNKLSFAIFGGRKDGYRGYSLSNRVSPGKWRVFVETKRGQVLGKISFTAKQIEESVETEIIIK